MPPNTVIPAMALFSGSPGNYVHSNSDLTHILTWLSGEAQFVEDLPESTQEMVEAHTKGYYTRFQPMPTEHR